MRYTNTLKEIRKGRLEERRRGKKEREGGRRCRWAPLPPLPPLPSCGLEGEAEKNSATRTRGAQSSGEGEAERGGLSSSPRRFAVAPH
ncbi:hypothetical protein AHAS_Ahas12G0104300 [Arachis hypogaea]